MKRRAVTYIRVSSAEQAEGYSLRGQQAVNDRAAAQYGAVVVERFVDSVSAKLGSTLTESFDRRPGWTSLLAYLREHPVGKGGPDLVVVKDYSRFCRHVAAGWSMLWTLQQMGVEIQAAEQPVDWASPEHVHVVGSYLAVPDADNRRRSMNIRRGIREAHLQGLWLHRPPYGYRATYEGGRRLGIEPEPGAAALLVEAFRMAADPGVSLETVRLMLRQRSRSPLYGSRYRFGQMLRNRAYLGELRVPAGDGEGERWVRGRHEPLVPPDLWAAVQERMDGPAVVRRGRERKLQLNPGLPLRGVLRAPDGSPLTGSAARSRHGYKVWYYHGRGAGAYRVAAEEAHGAFQRYLGEHAPTPGFLAVLRAAVEERLAEVEAGGAGELARARRALDAAEARAERIAADYAGGMLPAAAYSAAYAALRLEELRDAVREAEAGATASERPAVLAGIEALGALGELWERGSADVRRDLGGWTFPLGFAVEGGQVSNPTPNPLFSALTIRKTAVSEGAEPPKTAVVPSSGDHGRVVQPPDGSEPGPNMRLLAALGRVFARAA